MQYNKAVIEKGGVFLRRLIQTAAGEIVRRSLAHCTARTMRMLIVSVLAPVMQVDRVWGI